MGSPVLLSHAMLLDNAGDVLALVARTEASLTSPCGTEVRGDTRALATCEQGTAGTRQSCQDQYRHFGSMRDILWHQELSEPRDWVAGAWGSVAALSPVVPELCSLEPSPPRQAVLFCLSAGGLLSLLPLSDTAGLLWAPCRLRARPAWGPGAAPTPLYRASFPTTDFS